MAQLDCTVDSCVYYKSRCCCKGDIMVGGKHATCEGDTCCDSYSNRRNDSFTSALEHPCTTISIDCEATKCTYNNNYKCVAKHVDISGSSANSTGETCCATFSER